MMKKFETPVVEILEIMTEEIANTQVGVGSSGTADDEDF
jgi:hypothetical protein